MRSIPAILIARFLICGEFPSNPSIFLIITLLYFVLLYSSFFLSVNMAQTNISTPAHPPRAQPSIYSRTTLQSASDVAYVPSSVISILWRLNGWADCGPNSYYSIPYQSPLSRPNGAIFSLSNNLRGSSDTIISITPRF